MKKILSLLIVSCLCIMAFAGCSAKPSDPTEQLNAAISKIKSTNAICALQETYIGSSEEDMELQSTLDFIRNGDSWFQKQTPVADNPFRTEISHLYIDGVVYELFEGDTFPDAAWVVSDPEVAAMFPAEGSNFFDISVTDAKDLSGSKQDGKTIITFTLGKAYENSMGNPVSAPMFTAVLDASGNLESLQFINEVDQTNTGGEMVYVKTINRVISLDEQDAAKVIDEKAALLPK